MRVANRFTVTMPPSAPDTWVLIDTPPSQSDLIAAAVDAGILGYWMYRDGNQFFGGDGIVSKGVENTIRNVGRLAREGMKETDKEIIKIMLEKKASGTDLKL